MKAFRNLKKSVWNTLSLRVLALRNAFFATHPPVPRFLEGIVMYGWWSLCGDWGLIFTQVVGSVWGFCVRLVSQPEWCLDSVSSTCNFSVSFVYETEFLPNLTTGHSAGEWLRRLSLSSQSCVIDLHCCNMCWCSHEMCSYQMFREVGVLVKGAFKKKKKWHFAKQHVFSWNSDGSCLCVAPQIRMCLSFEGSVKLCVY